MFCSPPLYKYLNGNKRFHSKKRRYKVQKTKERDEGNVQEKCTTSNPTNIITLTQRSNLSTTYIITPTQGSDLSTPCFTNTFATELADLTSRQKEILIPTDNSLTGGNETSKDKSSI